jgi:hypothetical protein
MGGVRSRLGALVVGVLLAGACGHGSSDTTTGEEPWAAPAEAQFERITESFCGESDFEVAGHFAAGGSLDLRMWPGGPVATTIEEIAAATDQYFSDGGGDRFEVLLDDLYLADDGAIGVYRDADDGELRASWAIVYAIEDPRIAARAFTTSDALIGSAPIWYPLDDRARALYERYLDAWSSGDDVSIAEVYDADAVVVDGLDGTVWSGRDEIAAGIARSSAFQDGPAPQVFIYDLAGWQEVVATLQSTGPCPMREARRWILHDDRIVEDVGYRHVPSVRRCGLDLPDGWWAEFDAGGPELPVSDLRTVIRGEVVELVNAEPEQVDLVRWLFDRFALGLDRPDVRAIWFPPSVDCPGRGSFARRQDARFDDGHTVTFCLTDRDVSPWSGRTRWDPHVARVALHELAHVWLYDHLTDADRAAFLDHTGLVIWRDPDREWGELGVEHAAETIAWGLSGDDDGTYEIDPRPSCAELTARYELLTGRTPLTTCPGSPGSR